MSNDEKDGSFLGRWAARKKQASESSGISERDLLPNVNSRTSQVVVAESEKTPLATGQLPGQVVHTGHSMDLDGSIAEPVDSATLLEGSVTRQPLSVEGSNLLTDADMPPIESLDSGSDLSDFFNKGVSAALRKTALRHVFRQSSYNVRDGLNDYDGDFTSFEPLGDTVTSDMKYHAARLERNRLHAAAQEVAGSSEQLPIAEIAPSQHATASCENTETVSNEAGGICSVDDNCEHTQEVAGQRVADDIGVTKKEVRDEGRENDFGDTDIAEPKEQCREKLP